MRIILYPFIFVAGLVVQFGWMHYLSPYGLSPNFLMITLLMIGLVRGPLWGQVMGFAWGVAWDTLSVGIFGSHALLFTCLGYFSGLLNRKWNEDKVITQMTITGIASVFFWAGMYLITAVFGGTGNDFRLNYIIVLQPFYNMLVAPFIFKAGELLLTRHGAVGANDY